MTRSKLKSHKVERMMQAAEFMILLMSALIELSYFFLSLLLMLYCAWHYSRSRERKTSYLVLGFASLFSSATFWLVHTLMLSSGSRLSIIVLKLLECGGVVLFACFTMFTLFALRELLGR